MEWHAAIKPTGSGFPSQIMEVQIYTAQLGA